MKKLALLMSCAAVLAGCAATPAPQGGGVEGLPSSYEIVEEVGELKLLRGYEIGPWESDVKDGVSPSLLAEMERTFHEALEREKLLARGAETARISGRVLDISQSGDSTAVTLRLEIVDIHNWNPLGTVDIVGRARGGDSVAAAAREALRGALQFVIERAGGAASRS